MPPHSGRGASNGRPIGRRIALGKGISSRVDALLNNE